MRQERKGKGEVGRARKREKGDGKEKKERNCGGEREERDKGNRQKGKWRRKKGAER